MKRRRPLGQTWGKHFPRPLPDASPYTGDDVAELGARAALIPATATPAHAPGALMQHQILALAERLEAQPELARAVRQGERQDRTGRRARHQRTAPYAGVGFRCIGTTPPGVAAGGVSPPPGHLIRVAATLALIWQEINSP